MKRAMKFPRTDSGNAEMFAALYGEGVRFDHKAGRWLIWDKARTRWTEDEQRKVRILAKKTARRRATAALKLASQDERKREFFWATHSEGRFRIDAALELAKSEAPISDDGNGWDCDSWLLGVANGVVDLRAGKLRPAMQQDRITKSSPVVFNENAVCPRFDTFLAEVFDNDTALIEYVQKAVGYTLTGLTREQCFFACHGAGQNGKSTLFEVILYIMGDYGTDLPFSVLEKKKQLPVGEGMNLPGARFAKSVETREDLQLDEARIKSWTGGDTITINPKYRAPLSFTTTHKLWLAFNHRPGVTDDTDAMWRRVRLIPFKHTFDSTQADRELLDKLKAEAPGILNWAIQGCLAWQRDGLKTPEAVERATNDYEEESDVLSPFLADCCETDTAYNVPKGDLRSAYESWCSANRERPLGKKAFAERMLGHSFGEGSTGRVRYWTGLRLRPTDATDAINPHLEELPYREAAMEKFYQEGSVTSVVSGQVLSLAEFADPS
jgi:putative DNA primase/helicase